MDISYWEKTSFFDKIELIIVGSGIVGLNAAIAYKNINKKATILIIERGALPSGASTKNAGFACIGSASELISDLKKNTEEEVFNLVKRRKEGLVLLRNLLGDKAIEFESFGGYELFDKSENFESCAEKLNYLNRNLMEITGIDNTFAIADNKIDEFGFKGIKNLIFNNYEGQLNTGSMMKSLIKLAQKKGIQILNGIQVKEILSVNESSAKIILDDNFEISAKKVLLCTNGFAKKTFPQLNVTPGRAQVLVTSKIKNLKIKGSFHYNEGFYYFRNIDNRILLGGGRNLDFEGETTTDFGINKPIQNKLIEMLNQIILPGQKFSIELQWSGIMGLGETKEPIIQMIEPNIFCAVRLGGMGVAIGTLVGKEAAELIIES